MAGRHVPAIPGRHPGHPVDVSVATQTTSLGSAYVAGLATGMFPGRGELQRTRRTGHRDEPRMSEGQRQELYARWRQALDRARHRAREEA
jgi:glycerol kinase